MCSISGILVVSFRIACRCETCFERNILIEDEEDEGEDEEDEGADDEEVSSLAFSSILKLKDFSNSLNNYRVMVILISFSIFMYIARFGTYCCLLIGNCKFLGFAGLASEICNVLL